MKNKNPRLMARGKSVKKLCVKLPIHGNKDI